MIEVRNLTKAYDGFIAVNNISFKLEKGEIVAFLGPNGAGKTTTLRVLTGYFPPTSGYCEIGGYNILEHPLEVKKLIGYLPETNPLYEEMTPREYLSFLGNIHGVQRLPHRIDEVSEQLGICDVLDRPIREISRGYKRRVGLAQAILHDPPILILDEPTEGLDPIQSIQVRDLIKELGKEKTILLSTHILPEAETIAKRIIIIHKGEIVADTPRDKLHEISGGETIIYAEIEGPTDIDWSGIPDIIDAKIVKSIESRHVWELKSHTDIRPQIFKLVKDRGWTLWGLESKHLSLEEIFAQLTRE